MKKFTLIAIAVLSVFTATAQKKFLKPRNDTALIWSNNEYHYVAVDQLVNTENPKTQRYSAYLTDILEGSYTPLDTAYKVENNRVYRTVRHQFQKLDSTFMTETVVDKYNTKTNFWDFDSIEIKPGPGTLSGTYSISAFSGGNQIWIENWTPPASPKKNNKSKRK